MTEDRADDGNVPIDGLLDLIEQILDRRIDLPLLNEFATSLSRSSQAAGARSVASATAIAIDSSAFLRLNKGKWASDTIDYLSTNHPIPVILPGQAVQEFWNNQLAVMTTHAEKVSRSLSSMRADVQALDAAFGSTLERLQADVDQFHQEFREVYDETTIQDVLGLLEVFRTNGIIRFVPRLRFARFAQHRHATKTPPGFRDPGDGDFFVWLDTLYALGTLRETRDIDAVAIVTQDTKSDWQRGGVAHPILSAELRAIHDVPLEFWTVERLHSYVQAQLNPPAPEVAVGP